MDDSRANMVRAGLPRPMPERMLEKEMNERLADMEKRWKAANNRQKATIERLMEGRQDILNLMHNKSSLTDAEVKEIRRILNR